MILNRDGQANLQRDDSIQNFSLWAEQMDVVLCNPPFGAETAEKRAEILKEYDLGHVWETGNEPGTWNMTKEIAKSQQLGILFIERCWKMLRSGGRLAIILPEGYLSTGDTDMCAAGCLNISTSDPWLSFREGSSWFQVPI